MYKTIFQGVEGILKKCLNILAAYPAAFRWLRDCPAQRPRKDRRYPSKTGRSSVGRRMHADERKAFARRHGELGVVLRGELDAHDGWVSRILLRSFRDRAGVR